MSAVAAARAAALALLLAGCAANPVAPVAPPAPAAPPVAQPPVAPVPPPPAAPVAPPVAAAPVAPVATPPGRLEAYLSGLRAVSCPQGVRREEPKAIELGVSKVPLAALNPMQRKIGSLTFVAGFELTSPDRRLGGLSGVDLLDNGNLLAVSDQGDFVWIDLGADGVTPTAARIAAMKNERGEAISGKADGDAEGLAVNGGMALVSYERNDRVLAFDVGRCGAAARGAPIVTGAYGSPLRSAYSRAKIDVGDNSGPEPLAVTPDWYLFAGVEALDGAAGPLSARPIEAAPDFSLRIGEGSPSFVGADIVADGDDVLLYSLHRGTNRMMGGPIVVMETRLERYLDQANLPRRIIDDVDERSHYRFQPTASRRLAQMNLLVTIDNFEGIAAKRMPDGRVRLFLISDDNFSDAQRTLLMVYDADK